MSDNPVKRLLVELDTLLDTRFATIQRYWPEAAEHFEKTGLYWDRDCDDFETLSGGVIPLEDYTKRYAARTVDRLKMARPTGIVKLLAEISNEVESQKIQAPDIDSLKVDVNIYPYTFTNDEIEFLKTSVMFYSGLETEISIVSESLKALTPTRIRARWDGVILYDFNGWFTFHADELNTVPIPRHLMFAPALFIKPVESAEDVKVITPNGELSPFSALEMCFVSRLCLELLKPTEFSRLKEIR